MGPPVAALVEILTLPRPRDRPGRRFLNLEVPPQALDGVMHRNAAELARPRRDEAQATELGGIAGSAERVFGRLENSPPYFVLVCKYFWFCWEGL